MHMYLVGLRWCMLVRQTRQFARLSITLSCRKPPHTHTKLRRCRGLRMCSVSCKSRYVTEWCGNVIGMGKLCICVPYLSGCQLLLDVNQSHFRFFFFSFFPFYVRLHPLLWIEEMLPTQQSLPSSFRRSLPRTLTFLFSRILFSLNFFLYHFHHYLHLPVVMLPKRTTNQRRQFELEFIFRSG